MNNEELKEVQIQIGKIETRIEERDKSIFKGIQRIEDGIVTLRKEFNEKIENFNGCPKGEQNAKDIADNSSEIAVTKEKARMNRTLFWVLFVGFIGLAFTIIGSVFKFLPSSGG